MGKQRKKIIKSSAPGQYLGYSVQQVRLCHHLLSTEITGDSVSLEYLDDVAVHRANGSLLLEQCKSSLSSNPISDRSEELWKTFSNWAKRCTEDNVDAATTDFHLYITPIYDGALAAKMNAAFSTTEAKGIIEDIKALRAGDDGKGCALYIDAFLNAGEKICSQIITRFKLIRADDPAESVRVLLRALLPADTLDEFCAAAIGQARDGIDKLIRNKKLPILDAMHFRKRFHAFVIKYNLQNLLISNAPMPTKVEISSLLNAAPIFVQQLHAIEAKTDLINSAVADFIRTVSDKTFWAEEGVIVKNSLDELDEQLERHHILVRDEVEDNLSDENEKKRGREIYRRCSKVILPLEGRPLPSHFVSGAFNCLANIRRLGWHPKYAELFPLE